MWIIRAEVAVRGSGRACRGHDSRMTLRQRHRHAAGKPTFEPIMSLVAVVNVNVCILDGKMRYALMSHHTLATMSTRLAHMIESMAKMMLRASSQDTTATKGAFPARQSRKRASERRAAHKKATTGSSACMMSSGERRENHKCSEGVKKNNGVPCGEPGRMYSGGAGVLSREDSSEGC